MEPWQMKYPVGSKWLCRDGTIRIVMSTDDSRRPIRVADEKGDYRGNRDTDGMLLLSKTKCSKDLVQRIDEKDHVVPPPPAPLREVIVEVYPAFDPDLPVVAEARDATPLPSRADWRRQPQVFGAALRALYQVRYLHSWTKKAIRNRLYRDPEAVALRATPEAAVALAYALVMAPEMNHAAIDKLETEIKAKVLLPKKLKRRA